MCKDGYDNSKKVERRMNTSNQEKIAKGDDSIMMNAALKPNPSFSTASKIHELRQRALKRKNNPKLRHQTSDADVKVASENFDDLEMETYSTIKDNE